MNAVVVYQATFDDPADWVDLAIALASPDCRLVCVVAPRDRFEAIRRFCGDDASRFALHDSARIDAVPEQLSIGCSWIATGGFDALEGLIRSRRTHYREWVRRTFVVGGFANRAGALVLPMDPRLQRLHPERFGESDPRVRDVRSMDACLTSGEGVVWLPRDVCLWRFDAIGMLAESEGKWPGQVRALLRARDEPDAMVLMSSLPAFLLASLPDTTVWLRWFRVETARYDADAGLHLGASLPNIHVVSAIDGHLLSRRLVASISDAGGGSSS